MKDKIKKILTFIGFAVVVVAIIMQATDSNITGGMISVLPAIFAVCFIFSNNATLKNFGYALSAINISDAIAAFQYQKTVILGVGLIIMALASIFYFIEIVFGFFGYVINRTKGVDSSCCCGDDFSEVEKYAQMLAEDVINEEEFESFKAKIFAIDKKKVNSIDDLKKWKKLFDKNLISAEEYSSIKSKILK